MLSSNTARNEPVCHVSNHGTVWKLNGEFHCDTGPAISYLGFGKLPDCKVWYQHGKMHRVDGPAIEYPDGSVHWYWEGKQCRNIHVYCQLAKIPEEVKTLLLLKYS
ncbi:hypothetical protein UFOVP116_136 [uncultured Caudovirales phage]|uniref:Uncharacterized protein n=1 Tax=uncultured Caudovirales phage TaxID=2100421 RepID=A0A6J5L935_9CAUD|nr:hypothetical protein UFOVP116_136 [uncultured Caudovirales phage]